MKIAQITGNTIHWITPYKSMGELFVEVPDENGETIKSPKYSTEIVFEEVPDNVQEGWMFDDVKDQFVDPKTQKYWAVVNDNGLVTDTAVSVDKPQENAIEYNPIMDTVCKNDFYYEGEFMGATLYMSRRFDKIEDLIFDKPVHNNMFDSCAPEKCKHCGLKIDWGGDE